MNRIKNYAVRFFAGVCNPAVLLPSLALVAIAGSCQAQPLSQKKGFSRQDTLRGSLRPERTWWDVQRYDIHVTPDYATKTISGKVYMHIKKTGKAATTLMQLDLQEPMILDSVVYETMKGKSPVRYAAPIRREGNAWWAETKAFNQQLNTEDPTLTLYFHGKPREAVRPPWDGGWIWSKDKQGRPWMSVACQGLGASVWYPCKDHQSDEPDKGASLTMTVPDTLVAVGNGRLVDKRPAGNGLVSYAWNVTNPINNYNIIPYIGKYVTWHEDYAGEKGKLDCDYWVLDYNLDKATAQFKQAPKMLKCFEHWFGPYPFYEDGYKLVESPHLGMEHQSAVAYGNGFQNGYRGRDLSGSGWGTKWDFILVHESGHEWFANNITSNDIADMWIHEGFTNYSETIYTTCEFGVEAGNDYCIGTRKAIENDIPIIGHYGVNQEGSGDMYYKGGNLLHTIRNVIGDDEKFRQILRGLNKTYYHKTVDTKEIESYISQQGGFDFSKVFDQYLRTIQIPVLEYKTSGSMISYRWTNCVQGFNLPVKVKLAGDKIRVIKPTTEWESNPLADWYDGKTFEVDRNFYITTKKVQ
ncbi:M1 family metallopeptidase [Paraflavitalea sp. CAU 1676]|uniref:M1 family metallopeptidase n=1 Tax=Paraflavitalea sp. CAU 1676 TaxID=3032598 RepID=UPI0023DBC034|nr:M1 family metallopeptidase [Paraflavitalea sp. CAU 1676]MDF2187815.1 M1 family metallopeptidase [Paraflavitalea sp. CAU 1676]